MNAPSQAQGQNEAVTLLNQILNNPHRGNTTNEQQVIAIAQECTQLLNTVASGSELLKHPAVAAAKAHHGELTTLASGIAANAIKAKEELINLHKKYIGKQAAPIGDELMALIEIHQAYETWLSQFQQVILPPYADMCDLIQRITGEK